MIVWLSIEHLIGLHAQIIKKSGGEDGIRDRNSLEAALAAPLQTFGGQELFPGSRGWDTGWLPTTPLWTGTSGSARWLYKLCSR